MSGEPSDLGPVLPSAAALWAIGKELADLGERIKRAAGCGPRRDLRLAARLLDSARAVVGVYPGGDEMDCRAEVSEMLRAMKVAGMCERDDDATASEQMAARP